MVHLSVCAGASVAAVGFLLTVHHPLSHVSLKSVLLNSSGWALHRRRRDGPIAALGRATSCFLVWRGRFRYSARYPELQRRHVQCRCFRFNHQPCGHVQYRRARRLQCQPAPGCAEFVGERQSEPLVGWHALHPPTRVIDRPHGLVGRPGPRPDRRLRQSHPQPAGDVERVELHGDPEPHRSWPERRRLERQWGSSTAGRSTPRRAW